MCVCVCVYYYHWIDYYYSLIIVLFYSLGTRHCKVCSNRNRECCVEECWSLNRDCLYCKRHSDQKTRCLLKCLIWGRPDGSSLCCSTCNLLCRTNNCKNQLAKGSGTKLYVFNLFESQEMSCCRLQGSTL